MPPYAIYTFFEERTELVSSHPSRRPIVLPYVPNLECLTLEVAPPVKRLLSTIVIANLAIFAFAGTSAATVRPAKGAKGATGVTGADRRGAPGPQDPQADGSRRPVWTERTRWNNGSDRERRTDRATGPIGPSGVNSPLVFGPYGNTGQLPSPCGDNWANEHLHDDVHRDPPRVNGSFDVTELFQGTFAQSPGRTRHIRPLYFWRGGSASERWSRGYVVWRLRVDCFPPEQTSTSQPLCPPQNTLGRDSSRRSLGSLCLRRRGANNDGAYRQTHYATPNNGSFNNTDHGTTGNIFG